LSYRAVADVIIRAVAVAVAVAVAATD